MPSRPDVSRLFQHYGLDPQEYLSFSSEPPATALAASIRSEAAARSVSRVLDPALRSAELRARLLQPSST